MAQIKEVSGYKVYTNRSICVDFLFMLFLQLKNLEREFGKHN